MQERGTVLAAKIMYISFPTSPSEWPWGPEVHALDTDRDTKGGHEQRGHWELNGQDRAKTPSEL